MENVWKNLSFAFGQIHSCDNIVDFSTGCMT